MCILDSSEGDLIKYLLDLVIHGTFLFPSRHLLGLVLQKTHFGKYSFIPISAPAQKKKKRQCYYQGMGIYKDKLEILEVKKY